MKISKINKAVVVVFSVQRFSAVLKDEVESTVHNTFEFSLEAFVLGNFQLVARCIFFDQPNQIFELD